MENKVAVVLLNWNGILDTEECIVSLQKSSIPVSIYVVDNASKDKQAEKLQTRFPDIRVLAQHENLGFCDGNNVGIKQALVDGATHILILNNDTIVPDNAIEILYKEFSSIKGIGALSPVIMEHPDTDVVWFAKANWDESRAQFNMNPDKASLTFLKTQDAWESEFACGCCLFTSSAILQQTGLLDSRYFAYYDEADWCKRLEKNGYKSYTTSKALIYHKVSKSSFGLVSLYLMTRNRLLWMKENLSLMKRLQSFMYINKEYLWHTLNVWGWVKGQYSKQHSRAYLRAVADYRARRFGKWSTKTEKIIFNGR